MVGPRVVEEAVDVGNDVEVGVLEALVVDVELVDVDEVVVVECAEEVLVLLEVDVEVEVGGVEVVDGIVIVGELNELSDAVGTGATAARILSVNELIWRVAACSAKENQDELTVRRRHVD